MDEKPSRSNSPALPDELNGPTPRRVCLTDTGRRTALIMAFVVAVVLVIDSIGAVSGFNELRHRATLRSNGQLVVGDVFALRSGGRGSDEVVHYTFHAAGVPVSGSASVPIDFLRSVSQSKHLVIRYLPSDPAINHPDLWEWSPRSDLVPFLFSCFFGTLGTLGIVYLLRLRTMLVYGQVITATILSCKRDGRKYYVKYRFSSFDGAERKGGGSVLEPLETGARSWVLYLQDNPRRNCLYPISEYAIYG